MKFNVVYNNKISDYENALEKLKTALELKNADYRLFDINNLQNYGNFTFVIGGDGTLLKAAKFYSNLPVLGINLGRLGFLSQISIDNIEAAVAKVFEGKYSTEKRLMLESDNKYALNDFVIKGCMSSRTSKFFLEINGKFVCDYIADGLIISTPTGSTAYGLSAGGPVLYPTLEAIEIVPICPHTLNVRPLVVPFGEIITVKTSDKLLSVAVDGYEATECVEQISIKTSIQKVSLAFLNDDGFYSVLRNKLHWGISLTQD